MAPSPAEQLTALQPLIDFHARKLVGPAFRYVDRRDMEQDAAVAVLQRAGRFNGSVKLKTFHERRILGSMIDGLRRWHPKRKGRKHVIKWMAFEPKHAQVADVTPSHESTLLETQQHQRVASALAQLPPDEAHVIRRRFFGEVSYEEIAAELGLSVGRVMQLRRSGLQSLRQRLEAA